MPFIEQSRVQPGQLASVPDHPEKAAASHAAPVGGVSHREPVVVGSTLVGRHGRRSLL
jgi:hypothetical protein